MPRTHDADMQALFRGAVITIDGPAGSGKSTTARALARRLGFRYMDTGAMYRAAAWLGNELCTDLSAPDQVQALLARFDLRIVKGENGDRVFVADTEVTTEIRTPLIDKLVSPISAVPEVRVFMADWQRRSAAEGNVVLEGRDTGTVVCPDADVKIFLDASLETRARRRILQRGETVEPDVLKAEVAEIDRRDRADRGRAHAPLRRPDDAVDVNTSDCTIEEQLDCVYDACVERLRQRKA